MKSPDEAEPEFLIGARAIRAFLNELLKPAKFSEDQVYRLIEKKRLPAGKFGTHLIAKRPHASSLCFAAYDI
jgi:hypothetical protein